MSSFTAPLDGAQQGRLAFDGGTPELHLSAGQSPDRLVEASFEGHRPQIRTQDGEVALIYQTGFLAWIRHAMRPARARVALNPLIPWSLEFRGGVHPMTADLRALSITAIEMQGGVSRGELWLPRPTGTVRLSIGGGVSSLTIHRPAGTPIRVSVRGGISSVSIDGEELGGIGGGFRRETAGWHSAPDRLDLAVAGGVSNLTVTD